MKRDKKAQQKKHTERLGNKMPNPFLHQAHNQGSDAYMTGHPASHGGRRARDGFSRER